MRKSTIVLLVVIALVFMYVGTMSVQAQLSSESPWPTMRGDNRNTGRSPFVGPENPTIITAVQFPGYGMAYNSPVLSEGEQMIYFMSGDRDEKPGIITAVNRAGEILWTIETGATSLPAQGAGAVAEDGTLYFQADTKLYSINPDGTINWIYDGMGYGPVNSNSPGLAADGTIYILGGEFGYANWGMLAINPDGTEKWRSLYWSQAYGTPIVADDGFIYIAGHRRIYKINPEDGSKVWETPDSGQINQIAVLDAKGNTYLAVSPNMVISYDPDGNRRWFALLIGGTLMESRPALSPDEGTIYVGSHGEGARFHAVDTSNGRVKWNLDLGGGVAATPIVDANGTIYIGHGEKVHAINPDGTIKWSIDIPIGGSNGASFAMGKNGDIYGLTYNGFFIIGEAE